jgi:hypothetical protein
MPRILGLEARCFLIALAATLAYKMLTRRICLSGLLARGEPGSDVSPERVQLLMTTLVLGAKYITEVSQSTAGALPDVDKDWLAVFAGSSGVYASVKAALLWRKK